jgi:hypothetical protein
MEVLANSGSVVVAVSLAVSLVVSLVVAGAPIDLATATVVEVRLHLRIRLSHH